MTNHCSLNVSTFSILGQKKNGLHHEGLSSLIIKYSNMIGQEFSSGQIIVS